MGKLIAETIRTVNVNGIQDELKAKVWAKQYILKIDKECAYKSNHYDTHVILSAKQNGTGCVVTFRSRKELNSDG